MKYFSPSYWFKLWVLSIPLFNDKTQGINPAFPLERLIFDQNHRPGLENFNLPGLDLSKIKGNFRGNEIKELEIAIHQYEKEYNYEQYGKKFGKILILAKAQTSSKDDSIKKDDIYLTTDETNGTNLYVFSNQEKIIKLYPKFGNIVKDIILKSDGNILILTSQDKIYNINGLLIKKIQNVESSDLNKEIKIFYKVAENFYGGDGKKINQTLEHCSTLNNYHNETKYIVNLGKINPIDSFNKLEFLGDIHAQTNWGSWVYDLNYGNYEGKNTFSGNIIMKKRKNNFHDIIKPIGIKHEIFIQNFDDKILLASVKSRQSFWLNWYWENGDYFFSITFHQYFEWWACDAILCGSMEMGNGIRLYNDDANTRNKRDVFDISKLNEKKYNNKTIVTNELKNITKWTDDTTKSINHKQNLPTVTNTINYNITNGTA